MKKKVLLSVSGGMDSTTLLYWAIHKDYDVSVLMFDYGQNHKKELDMAEWHCENLQVPYEVVDLAVLNKISNSSLTSGADAIPEGHYAEDNMKSTVVPFRNGLFLAIMTAYAEANDIGIIMLGNHAGDHAIYPDCRTEFVEAFSQAAALGTYRKVKVVTPFTEKTKADICHLGDQLQVPYEKTWTCYKGGDEPCGKCGTCVERTEAFLYNGLQDPLIDDETWKKFVDYYNKAAEKFME